MMEVFTGLRELRFVFRDYFINRANRAKLKHRDISIISSDCTGGVLSHDLQMRFKSPTVNFFFMAQDYLRFIQKPEYYLDARMVEVSKVGVPYPVVQLGDIELYLVHYPTVALAQEAWDRRKCRLDLNRAWYIMNDRNNCTESDIALFDSLTFPHKVCFVHRKDWANKYHSAYYIKGFEREQCVGTMTAFPGKVNIRRNVDQFDYVEWLNEQC